MVFLTLSMEYKNITMKQPWVTMINHENMVSITAGLPTRIPDFDSHSPAL